MLFGVVIQTTPFAAPQRVAAVTLLETYDRGDYAAANHALDQATGPTGLDHLDADLAAQENHWIEIGEAATRRRRTFVAGAVALEVTRALMGRASWSTLQLSGHIYDPMALLQITRLIAHEPDAATSNVEHDWILATLATWEQWGGTWWGSSDDWRSGPAEPGWAVLLGRAALLQHSAVLPAVRDPVFLDWALQRFRNDPRLLLAETEAHEAVQTRCDRLFCHDEMTPEVVQDLQTRAKANPPDNQAAGCRLDCWPNALLHDIHDSAVANLATFDQLLPMASEFARLANEYPSVRAEANVHIGYLAIRAARPDAAIQPLATGATSDDPYVRYLAEHLRGRALEMLGRRADAIAAYRRALSIVPNAASTSTLLAAQLFVGDDAAEQTEAHSILAGAIAASPRPVDPWDFYWQGDARLLDVDMRRLQEDLRR